MTPDRAPLVRSLSIRVPPVAAGSDATENTAEAPFDGTVTEVSYTPDAAITGAATNNRTISVVNKKQDGTGTAVVATLTFNSGVNAAANDELQVALSGTAANLVVAQDDILAFVSTHNGTGIADPGGLVEIEFAHS